jgi:hypothetical protein
MQVRVDPQPQDIIDGGFLAAVAGGRLERHDDDANNVYGGEARPAITAVVIDELQRNLSGIGYFCPPNGRYGECIRPRIEMFQEHSSAQVASPQNEFGRGQIDVSAATMIRSVSIPAVPTQGLR